QEKWASLKIGEIDLETATDPYYLLVEFPYPSGDLHIGHWYAFALTDMYARMLRQRGKDVLFPIGFDAFGLPAENAAIKHGVDPKEWTMANIERMRRQLMSMGSSFDWSKEVIACDPSYYQWTQWLFTKLFEHGLAVRKTAPVKWCPKDQTVLANEQIIDGKCERDGTPVEERILTQWFLKITDYAERLLEGLNTLPWREEIKEAQRAWIGKSEGAFLYFAIPGTEAKIKVFTTRPDTVFGATYVVLAPEHALVGVLDVENRAEVDAYVTATGRKTERERSENKEKTGVRLKGVTATNPATNEEIPVFVADYVLNTYGTGAVMAVPAHDERDFEFAKRHKLPVRIVVEGGVGHDPYTGPGTLIESGTWSGRQSEDAKWEMIEHVGGERTTNYRLRDWLVSRQRYWGCPIPIVYDPEGRPHPIPAEHLPWLLPTDVDFKPSGEAPLASSKELKERVTRIFGEGWTPEYDTLDTFVDSSWYFTRYLDPKDANQFSDQTLMKKWLPVNRYSGGSEHTTMHLLYARFFMKALYDLALVPVEEPFEERFNRGLIMGTDGQKMSKSKGNVLNPDEFVAKFGADAVRVYLAFIGPYNEPGSYPWNLDGVASMRKFLERVARMAENATADGSDVATAQTAAKVAEDGDRFKFNTGVAALMTLLNSFEEHEHVSIRSARAFITMLAPFAPHLAEHLWEKLGGEGSVHRTSWPESTVEQAELVEVVVQVNGKRRGSLMLSPAAAESEALLAAKSIASIASALDGTEPRRTVYVPGRIINLVI
ncbi:MAG TPA: leucine--tRNA ligase, partial [Candidatus Paceibacterota bacterium]|nr:leucine--tRNA ligase [Candidatus Paceibacterota bacterium]